MTTAVKKPINRLKTMYALRGLADKAYEAGLQAQKEGKPVVWVMRDYFSSPILNALDVESVYPENYGALCAASEAASASLARSDAEGFPTHLCGYARNTLGFSAVMAEFNRIPQDAPAGGMPEPIALLSSGTACDSRFKWFQALGRYLDAPVWTVEFPNPGAREDLNGDTHERTVDFLKKEVRELIAFLERRLGKKLDWDIFDEQVDRILEMEGMFWKLNDLRKARPCPMHSRDFWSSMTPSLFRAKDTAAVTRLYSEMCDEVKDRIANNISGINYEEKHRLTFEGLPPWHALDVFDRLAEKGWNLVIERQYHPPRPIDRAKYPDPVERLVRYRFRGIGRQIEEEFEPEEADRIKREVMQNGFTNKLQAKCVRDYHCDAGFIHITLSCRAVSAGLPLVQSQFMEEWRVPSLVVEGDIVDHSVFNAEDVLRRADAFEETIEHYTRLRRQSGLDW